jgi:hypothetical protein
MTGNLTSAFCDAECSEIAVERTDAPRARFSLADRMFVERGSVDDWNLLHDLHYKAENLAVGSRFWKLTLDEETIGVLVTASPKGMLRERHIVFPKLKPGSGETKITNTYRYNYINANFRVVSRFVIDTMYRGIGAGYRMMNLVSRMEGNTFMEIQSSMSKFNIFGQKAGFRFVSPQNANKYEKGLKFFRTHFHSSPSDIEALENEVAAMGAGRDVMIQALRDFYLKNSALENTGATRERGEGRVAAMSVHQLIKAIQQVALASPMYGVWKCPDQKGTVPERLPLTAFDWQAPTAKFSPR